MKTKIHKWLCQERLVFCWLLPDAPSCFIIYLFICFSSFISFDLYFCVTSSSVSFTRERNAMSFTHKILQREREKKNYRNRFWGGQFKGVEWNRNEVSNFIPGMFRVTLLKEEKIYRGRRIIRFGSGRRWNFILRLFRCSN